MSATISGGFGISCCLSAVICLKTFEEFVLLELGRRSLAGVREVSLCRTLTQFLCVTRIINLADRQEGFGLIPLGPQYWWKRSEQQGGFLHALSCCSSMLLLKRTAVQLRTHVGQGWWGEEETYCKYQRCQESRYWERRGEWSPKAGVGIGRETSSSISWAIVDFASGYASRLATSNTVVEFSCSWINNSPWTSGFEFVFAILLMLLFEVNRRFFFPGKVLFILILLNRFFPPFYQLIL